MDNELKALSLKDEINANHRECLRAGNEAIRHAYEAGRLLREVKGLVNHGNFGGWVGQFCDFTDRAARGYMTWMCGVLELPDPGIRPTPEADVIEAEADAYVAQLLEHWRTPLAGINEEKFFRPEYTSRWKVSYCIDAMLEHAVMHPILHRFQLLELMGEADQAGT